MREVPEDHGREQERRERDREAESDDNFDFGLVDEAECESAKESEGGHKGSSRKEEPKPTKHGGGEFIKGDKTEDALETTNSDESEN